MHQQFKEWCARIQFLHLSQWIRKHLFATRWKLEMRKALRNLRVIFFVFPADIKVLGFPGLAKVGGNRSQLAGHAKLGRGLVNKKFLKIWFFFSFFSLVGRKWVQPRYLTVVPTLNLPTTYLPTYLPSTYFEWLPLSFFSSTFSFSFFFGAWKEKKKNHSIKKEGQKTQTQRSN